MNDILTFATLDPADEQEDSDLAAAAREASAALLVTDDTDAAADRRRWREKAIKAVKQGKPATFAFKSEAIPEDEQARIRAALEGAKSVADVAEAFKAVGSVDGLLSAEWEAATAWAEEALGDA